MTNIKKATLASLEQVKLRCQIADELLHVEKTAENCSENIPCLQQKMYTRQGIMLANTLSMPSLLERFPKNVHPTMHDFRNRQRAQENTCSSWPEGIKGSQKKISIAGLRNPEGDTHVMAISDICMNLDLIRLKEANPQMYAEKGATEANQASYCQQQALIVHRWNLTAMGMMGELYQAVNLPQMYETGFSVMTGGSSYIEEEQLRVQESGRRASASPKDHVECFHMNEDMDMEVTTTWESRRRSPQRKNPSCELAARSPTVRALP